MPIRIDYWQIVHDSGLVPYTAPELVRLYLRGFAHDHPKLGSQEIQTSAVINFHLGKNGARLVTTKSGSVYLLGKINPKYRKWLKKHYPNWNWREPIKMLG